MPRLGALVIIALGLAATPLLVACGGTVQSDGKGGSDGEGGVGADGNGGGSVNAAILCTESGGTVIATACFANPPFAQYTCASGENGSICDPAPGEAADVPECVCPDPMCFDPVTGCTAP